MDRVSILLVVLQLGLILLVYPLIVNTVRRRKLKWRRGRGETELSARIVAGDAAGLTRRWRGFVVRLSAGRLDMKRFPSGGARHVVPLTAEPRLLRRAGAKDAFWVWPGYPIYRFDVESAQLEVALHPQVADWVLGVLAGREAAA